jgi:hypothetical protein
MSLRQRKKPCALLLALIILLTMTARLMRADTGTCNGQTVTLPFTDVQGNAFFCAIASAFFSGLTNGTTATTYSPAATVSREQMAAFVSRTLDQSLRRGSPRAALQRFWVPRTVLVGLECTNGNLRLLASDGTDVWVANPADNEVIRFSTPHGQELARWTGATQAFGVLALDEEIYATGRTIPGKLFRINTDAQSGGVASELTDEIGGNPEGITFDGLFFWTANASGSISRYNLNGAVTTFTSGFTNPRGILFDGTDLWVTDSGDNSLKKVNLGGAVVQTITVGTGPRYLAFDGVNLWVPNFGSDSVTVVRASTGQVLATLTANGLDGPLSVAFDGERIAVTNNQVDSSGRVSFWRATDLTPLGVLSAIHQSFGICSDGTRFFVADTSGCVSRF